MLKTADEAANKVEDWTEAENDEADLPHDSPGACRNAHEIHRVCRRGCDDF